MTVLNELRGLLPEHDVRLETEMGGGVHAFGVKVLTVASGEWWDALIGVDESDDAIEGHDYRDLYSTVDPRSHRWKMSLHETNGDLCERSAMVDVPVAFDEIPAQIAAMLAKAEQLEQEKAIECRSALRDMLRAEQEHHDLGTLSEDDYRTAVDAAYEILGEELVEAIAGVTVVEKASPADLARLAESDDATIDAFLTRVRSVMAGQGAAQ